MKQTIRLLTTWLLASLASFQAAATGKPVKVFLLAGQSNMEGAGQIEASARRATTPSP